MSIEHWLQGCVERQELIPITPLIESDPHDRKLYVTSEIYSMLTNSHAAHNVKAQWAEVRAVMDAFVGGVLISASKDKKQLHARMKLLDKHSDGVWALRSSLPSPGIRILGHFLSKDIFIALNWRERIVLEGYNSFAWKRAIQECRAKWLGHFPAYQPLIGEDCNDCISNIYVI